MLNRRSVLAGGVASVAALSSRNTLAAPPHHKNVLLLISDDQGLDLGCYGVPISTPRLDALAGQGTLFKHAYAAVSSCSPSRAVINTGLFTHANGMYGLAHDVHNQSIKDGIETLPALMREGGYATALVGKKHLRPEAAFPYEAELVPEKSGIRDVKAMSDAASAFIKNNGDRPFFVTIAYSDPHRAEGGYANEKPWPGVQSKRYDPNHVQIPSHLPDIAAVRQDLAGYYESVSRLDSGVGMVLDALQNMEKYDDTLIIFLSDNGRPFAGAKTNLYDPGLHLPLIVRHPNFSPVVSSAMVSWVDIMPTVLNYTGVSGPNYALQGRSLLPVLGKQSADGWDQIFASHDFHEINQYYPMRAIRTRTHSYILNIAHPLDYPIAGDVATSESWKAISVNPALKLGKRSQTAFLKRPMEELYDLRSDPDEVVNLVNDPASMTLLNEMRQRLTAWRKETRDPWLSGVTDPYSHLDSAQH